MRRLFIFPYFATIEESAEDAGLINLYRRVQCQILVLSDLLVRFDTTLAVLPIRLLISAFRDSLLVMNDLRYLKLSTFLSVDPLLEMDVWCGAS